MIKKILFEITGENLEEAYVQDQEAIFLSELNSKELKYSLDNVERYAKYLNDNLSFPVKGYFTVDNGMFGYERIEVQIQSIIENRSRQGLKCLCKSTNNTIHNLFLNLVEIDEKDPNKKMITHFHHWYDKHHQKNKPYDAK